MPQTSVWSDFMRNSTIHRYKLNVWLLGDVASDGRFGNSFVFVHLIITNLKDSLDSFEFFFSLIIRWIHCNFVLLDCLQFLSTDVTMRINKSRNFIHRAKFHSWREVLLFIETIMWIYSNEILENYTTIIDDFRFGLPLMHKIISWREINQPFGK